jgi:hypothetical protein
LYKSELIKRSVLRIGYAYFQDFLIASVCLDVLHAMDATALLQMSEWRTHKLRILPLLAQHFEESVRWPGARYPRPRLLQHGLLAWKVAAGSLEPAELTLQVVVKCGCIQDFFVFVQFVKRWTKGMESLAQHERPNESVNHFARPPGVQCARPVLHVHHGCCRGGLLLA